jgi:phosphoribosylanthranilate isomerase
MEMNRKQLELKVCGMRDPKNLEELCDLAPEFVGYIFYPKSKRFVGNEPDPALFQIPGPKTKKVGVFVNAETSRVSLAIKNHMLDVVQLHGGESVEYCRRLEGEAIVIKVLDPNVQQSGLDEYADVVDYFLFDTPGEGYGGTGRKFDWDLLHEISSPVPFLLSGGIGPADVGDIKGINHKQLMGVDLNSMFELAPGQKDIYKLKEFFLEIRK